MKKPTFPTPEQIKEVIKKIEGKNYLSKIKMKQNEPVKEGLKDCLRILNDRLKNPDNPYFIADSEEEWNEVNEIFMNQLKGIEKLQHKKSRAMAILCVDWLNGNEKAINFLNEK